VPKSDGTYGVFQPLDDIFDGIMSKLDPSLAQADVTRFIGLDCVQGAMRRVCDFRGASSYGSEGGQPSLMNPQM